MVEVSDERFDEMVENALDAIPEEFARNLRNVAILVQDRNEDNPRLLGLYHGVMLTHRTFDHTGHLPDTISIYKEALKEYCGSEEQLEREVRVTVFHEIGHYFGMEEDRLHELGWG